MSTEAESIALALLAFGVYWGVVEWLRRRGTLQRFNITAYGPVLMIRTKKGLKLLEKLSRPKRFWRLFADLGLPAVFVGMIFMFSLILIADYVMLTTPPKPSELTSPRAALLLPGINPFIPLVWGAIGLAVTLVIHEFSHAILCRVEGVTVKSLGIILALVPIGGFAEPEESEIMDRERTKSSARIRIYSAGVVSNFAVAFVAFALFFSLLPSVQPALVLVDDSGVVQGRIVEVNGVKVGDLEKLKNALQNAEIAEITIERDGILEQISIPAVMGVKVIGLYSEDGEKFPAELAGMKAGMLIVRIDDTQITGYSDFQRKMQETKPGQEIEVLVYENGTFRTFNLTLAGKGERGFMGVYVSTFTSIDGVNVFHSQLLLEELKSVPELVKSFGGWLYLIAMPFRFQGFTGPFESLFIAPQWIFWTLNTLYWVGWINFYVGLFNCLPAVPLDGGRVFHEVFAKLLSRKYGERAEEISMKVVKFFAFIVFFSILMSITIPNIGGLI